MPPNLLLVVVDALRADAVAPYDAGADTPAIASLADEGTVFERAVSPAPWTLPSVTSLLTGRYPHEHGATAVGFDLQRGRPLQAQLSAEGYRCVHVSPTTWIGEWLPQGRGFDVVEEFTGPVHRRFAGGADVRRLSAGVARGPSWYATVAKRALASDAPARSLANAAAYKLAEARGDHWLDRRASDRAATALDAQLAGLADADEPFFAYVHLMDPHLPYYVPRECQSSVRPPGCRTDRAERRYVRSLLEDVWRLRLGERRLSADERAFLRTRYADAVAYADGVVGELLDALDRHGCRDETVVALASDHGEHLGEPVDGRTLVGHQTSVRLPVLRVPLVVSYPGEFDGDRRTDLVQPTGVAATMRALAGLDHRRSRSLLPRDAAAHRETAVAEYAGVVRSHPPDALADEDRLTAARRTAIAGDWKLDVVGDRRRAARVDWDGNRSRTVDVGAVPRAVRARLASALPPPPADGPGTDGASATEGPLPSDVADRLADLGYR